MNKTIKIEDLKEYDGAWYRKDKDGLCDIFTMVDLKDLLAQQKEEFREIIKCKACNGKGSILATNLGVSECQECGGDGHCLSNYEGENLSDILEKL